MNFRIKTKNDFLNYIEEVRKHLKLSKEEFCKKMNIQVDTLYSYRAGLADNDNKQPLTRKLAQNLHTTYNLDLEKLLLPIEKEKAWFGKNKQKKERYFTHDHWNSIKAHKHPDSWIEFFPFNTYDQHTNNKLIEAYKKISKYFEDSEVLINVHELLFKGDNRNPGQSTAYKEAQKEVLKAIEQALYINCNPKNGANKNFHYTRIFSLSRSRELYSKDNPSRLQRAFVGEVSYESLDHILRCMNNYPDNCSFYISPASQYRHHALVDDKLLTEDYVNRISVILPASLIVHNVRENTKAHTLKKLLQDQLRWWDKDIQKIENGDIEDQIKEAQIYIENQIKKRKKTIEVLRSINNSKSREITELISREKTTYNSLNKQLKSLQEKSKKLGLRRDD